MKTRNFKYLRFSMAAILILFAVCAVIFRTIYTPIIECDKVIRWLRSNSHIKCYADTLDPDASWYLKPLGWCYSDLYSHLVQVEVDLRDENLSSDETAKLFTTSIFFKVWTGSRSWQINRIILAKLFF